MHHLQKPISNKARGKREDIKYILCAQNLENHTFFLAVVINVGQLPGQHPEINTRDSKNTKFLVKSGNLEFDDE